MSASPSTNRRAVNGIELDVIEAGDPDGPAVVLCHGFPESAYSWRHQIGPLAAAGYHVLAPDQRGYGASSAPDTVEAYGTEHLTGDIVGLLDDAGHTDATIVGHDWGALVMWDLCRLHPDRIRAAVGVSVPYTKWPCPPTELFRAISGDRFFYILYFQPVGPAETELESDVEATLRTVLWAASGEGAATSPTDVPPAEGTGWIESMLGPRSLPDELPAWLTADDLATYVAAFERSGFFGPLSWYRNLDHNYDVVHELPGPSQPTAFIGGSRDPVITSRPGFVESMTETLPDHRGSIMLEGLGHWTQQEDPGAFNEALFTQLASTDPQSPISGS